MSDEQQRRLTIAIISGVIGLVVLAAGIGNTIRTVQDGETLGGVVALIVVGIALLLLSGGVLFVFLRVRSGRREEIPEAQGALRVEIMSRPDELERLIQHRRAGDITEEEFSAAKAKLLGL